MPRQAGPIEATTGPSAAHFAGSPTDLAMLALASEELGPARPLAGARIAVFCRSVSRIEVLLHALQVLGAELRWIGESSAAIASGTEDDGIADRVFDWPDGGLPNLIIDEGAIAARLVHLGVAVEAGLAAGWVTREDAPIECAVRRRLETHPAIYSAIATNVVGLSECTARGIDRIGAIARSSELLFPVIDASHGQPPHGGVARDRIARDTLDALFVRQVLVQVEIHANGAAYGAVVNRFPARLARAARELGDRSAGAALGAA